ncbi:energy-coupling factor transporter transmembrane component T [Paenibacillus protaetiae]|uniref:Energy-coupling factor transporter transmembrane protein EcfT n=1 Tax=Paenibacillus protaetiae TaxID=2509456 RepID=A0A4P6EW94_9BACL|nr:energy-coupling factor transporter transmembrane component T [Paenibacillus protaetiae]QAY66865.1 energy-coupling factor transporter transmembrane protein EcfT [Paenibacillus protaetiae]
MRRDSFSSFHPAVNFVYFAAVLAFAMLFMHPVLQIISFCSAASYSILLNRRRAVRFLLLYMLPLWFATALMNPAFNHAGVTILFYLHSGNPVTLESILYGAAAGFMFVTVLIWFSCYNAVMTSDKFVYLFGRLMPALSLMLSMALRFVPRYRSQLAVISKAQRGIGRDMTQGHLLQRARNGLTMVSILTTWALENAIETADSMKSRGYGLPGRSSFSLFRFDSRDKITGLFMAVLLLVMAAGAAAGRTRIRFFPSVKTPETDGVSIILYAAYAVFCLLPVCIQLAEERKWKSIQSKM